MENGEVLGKYMGSLAQHATAGTLNSKIRQRPPNSQLRCLFE